VSAQRCVDVSVVPRREEENTYPNSANPFVFAAVISFVIAATNFGCGSPPSFSGRPALIM
jgi:hypothetical protein